MGTQKLTVSVVKQKTRELLGGDDIDYGYITDDLVQKDSALGPEVELKGDKAINTVYIGNNPRYGAMDINGTTYQGYFFDYAPGDPCGSSHVWFVTVDWHHNYVGKCPNGREQWTFTFGE